MLTIQVSNQKQTQQFEHASGPLEFGRGPKRKSERFVINDLFVSRDQLRIEELPHNRVLAENLSNKQEVLLADGSNIGVGGKREISLPVRLVLGQTFVDLLPVTAEVLDQGSLSSVNRSPSLDETTIILRPLKELGDSPAPEQLAGWLETVIQLQRSVGGMKDFYDQSARALVELIGLDQGLTLLRRDFNWEVVGRWPADLPAEPPYSRTLLSHVAAERRTFYQDLKKWHSQSDSLRGVEAAVVSPIYGAKDEVIGALYGVRSREILTKGGIRPLEAQAVQLLAANIGVNLSRVQSIRTQAQLEQFFPPNLWQELQRDPSLLEGREQEVTLLVGHLRGYADMVKRLGPYKGCLLARDLMERVGERILEQKGVIVDLSGDGILAMWNAPLSQRDHALLACGAALGMQEEMQEMNDRWKEQAGGPLAVSIGLHTGTAQVGSMGSSQQFKYRAYGPALDMVRKVQDATSKFGKPVLMSGAVQNQLPDTLATRRLCQVRYVPNAEPVAIYELFGVTATPEWLTYRDAYESALMQYEFGQWSRAAQTLAPLLEQAERQDVSDKAALTLMRQACLCLEYEPAPFDPVFDLERD
jgi:adenylate cyclase